MTDLMWSTRITLPHRRACAVAAENTHEIPLHAELNYHNCDRGPYWRSAIESKCKTLALASDTNLVVIKVHVKTNGQSRSSQCASCALCARFERFVHVHIAIVRYKKKLMRELRAHSSQPICCHINCQRQSAHTINGIVGRDIN